MIVFAVAILLLVAAILHSSPICCIHASVIRRGVVSRGDWHSSLLARHRTEREENCALIRRSLVRTWTTVWKPSKCSTDA